MVTYVNVRRILLKHKRGAKTPMLNKFVKNCFKQNRDNFVSISDIFTEYRYALSIWTDGDSESGQTKVLIKEKAFQRVSTFFIFALKNIKKKCIYRYIYLCVCIITGWLQLTSYI